MIEFTLYPDALKVAIAAHEVLAVVENTNGCSIVMRNGTDLYRVREDYTSVKTQINKASYDVS